MNTHSLQLRNCARYDTCPLYISEMQGLLVAHCVPTKNFIFVACRIVTLFSIDRKRSLFGAA
jgi:hypothetical protein